MCSIAAGSRAILLILLLAGQAGQALAQNFDTKAKQAFMVDAETGTVLFAKDADRKVPPASLAKLMTMELVFDAVAGGRLAADQSFQVSENAWRTGGAPSRTSTMFAAVKSFVPVADLMQGAIVISANDACIVLAEGMAGSEAAFVERMNERATALGLSGSVFRNSTGLPAEGQTVTMRDLVRLARHIWQTYPQFYPFYAQREYKWNNINQQNRNPLLRMEIGADGLKTGYTEESGYAIVGSVARDGRRLFVAMGGMATDKERAEESRRLLDWGMRAFRRVDVFAADEVVGQARTYGAAKSGVDLRADGAVSILLPDGSRDKVIARIVYQGPVEAPVKAGTEIGRLKVWVGEELIQERPLYAAEDVAAGSLRQRAVDAIGELAFGWLR